MASRLAQIVDSERGTTAVQFALVAPALLVLMLGIINVASLLWTLSSLEFAAESAARCASVNTSVCSSASTIQNYALSQYHGQDLGGFNPFTYTASGCGNTVSASYNYALTIPFLPSYQVPLTASACFP